MSTASSPEASSSPIPVQPDHFYGQEPKPTERGYFDPNDDPSASRGIPVFRPSMNEFQDFEGYLNEIECWGMRSGIVKIIPPLEWTNSLPSVKPQLKHVKLRNPIEQEFIGSGGLFRQQNIEKRRIMSVREWADQCARVDMRAPTVEEAQGGRRYTAPPGRGKAKRTVKDNQAQDVGPATVGVEEGNANAEVEDEEELDNPDLPDQYQRDADSIVHNETPIDVDVDPTSSLPTPPATTVSHSSPNAAGSPPLAIDNPNSPSSAPATLRAKRTASERHRAKEILDDAFLARFDPDKDWLPKDMKPQDYTPEFCKLLEKIYWRSCGFGKAPWYGADMKGSLFTSATKYWNVATLPSALSRLLGTHSQISGVNTPYLYFGMWRATFAWHVEDMDLFSINYIHFGAPKFWYAIPQSRASNLETTMKGYFPRDTSNCPQFLRHKSFLASPSKLGSTRPNTLVQHPGEFVVTFPRGYHAGFNLGFNCAESVNFALESWIELGKKAAYCACIEDSVKIDVVRLLKEREMERNDGPIDVEKRNEDVRVGSMPNMKRKVEVIIDSTGVESSSKAKRPKTSSAVTATPSKARPKSNVSGASSAVTTSSNHPAPVSTHFPCCLCPSLSTDGLLRVHDPPSGPNTPSKPPPGIPWRAHELCARVIPETWIDDDPNTVSGSDGKAERVVWGVDGIVKDRWMLKCSICTRPASKSHGAPIQCTKGKCSKAFHVTCAAEATVSPETIKEGSGMGAGVAYRVLEEVEKEVVLVDDTPDVEPPSKSDGGEMASHGVSGDVQPPSSTTSAPAARQLPNVIKTIKKLLVEVLCSQHNPASIALKKASKEERLRHEIEALKEMDRIRIRNSSGVFEVSLVQVHKDRRTVEVLWDSGQKREFKWGSIVWSWNGETDRKPTAEEIAASSSTPSVSKSQPKPSTASTLQNRPSPTISAPVYNGYPAALFSFQTQYFKQQQQQRQGLQQGQGQTHISSLIPQPGQNLNDRLWYQGMNQIRVPPPTIPGTNLSSAPSTSNLVSRAQPTGTSAITTDPKASMAVPTMFAPAVVPIPPTAMPLNPAQIAYHNAYFQSYYQQQYAMYAGHSHALSPPFAVASSSSSTSELQSTSASIPSATTVSPTLNAASDAVPPLNPAVN